MEEKGDEEKNTTPFINEKDKLSLQDTQTGKHLWCMLEFWRKKPRGKEGMCHCLFVCLIVFVFIFIFIFFLCFSVCYQ
jgi:t-SNARE complex subunit (syntaxin)